MDFLIGYLFVGIVFAMARFLMGRADPIPTGPILYGLLWPLPLLGILIGLVGYALRRD